MEFLLLCVLERERKQKEKNYNVLFKGKHIDNLLGSQYFEEFEKSP